MNCEQFLLKMDAYIDDELSNGEINEMRAHALDCDSCRAELKKAEIHRETLKEMDNDLVVPLEAQAAWRKAVRAEAQRKNVRKWTRGLYVVAAALVLVLGCTLAMNNDIFSSKRVDAAPVEPSVVNANESIAMVAAEDANVFEAYSAEKMGTASDNMRKGAVMIAADGVEEQEEGSVEVYSAVKKYAVADVNTAGTLIRNLAAEYEAVSVECVELDGDAFYCVELPFDYQGDFLSALSVLGDELTSEIFDVEMSDAVVRINLVAE